MDQVSSPPLVSNGTSWELQFKRYPHFDAPLSRKEIERLVYDPRTVTANSFYPFVRYYERWQPFRGQKRKAETGKKPEKKERPIRFASRRDAYIFSYYRHLISAPYERILAELNLIDSVIAYRKLHQSNGSGKSNIHFARDAFDHIRRIGNCAVVALDVSSFFESLDHARLREQWLRVIGLPKLPPDHEAVYAAMTNYAVVDREKVFQRLGYLKSETVGARVRLIYTKKYDELPIKLCSNAEFQEKICGKGGAYKSLIEKNRKPYGIPQGSQISDMLANIYMIDFDVTANNYCIDRGGVYFRYSDDILMIIPGGDEEARQICKFAAEEIVKHGPKLFIKDKKTAALVYTEEKQHQVFRHVKGQQGKRGLEYLGFRYDGINVYIRDSTLSRLYRKIAKNLKSECIALARRYPHRNATYILSKFDQSNFFERFGRVRDFEPAGGYHSWTFWTYAIRARRVFGPIGAPIIRQLRNYKKVVRGRIEEDIRWALDKR